MRTYKVVYESYFGEDDCEVYIVVSEDKKKINEIAKKHLGLVYEVDEDGTSNSVYLGKYTYDSSDIWSDEPKIIWKKAV